MTTSSLILTVSELTQAIKFKLEGEFTKLYVQGEVSNLKKQMSGHVYFTLKDAGAQIQCVMFASDARSLRTLPAIGDQVQVMGEMNVYPPRGNYQIIVRQLKGTGLGQLLMMLEERKQKYLQMGWFDAALKKRVPKSAPVIGVITSPTGAVIQDILHVLKRRAPSFHVRVGPVKVQGEGAKEEIAQMIRTFDRYQLADVLILARGGGSMEDLWPFNEPCVVESIHNCSIPLVSAVGHETDTTLADLVADLRAPTPSAAAELVSLDKVELSGELLKYQARFQQVLKQFLQSKRAQIQSLGAHPFLTHPKRFLNLFEQKLDEASYTLDRLVKNKLVSAQRHLHAETLRCQSYNPLLRLQKSTKKLSEVQRKLDYELLNRIEKAHQKLRMNREKLDFGFERVLQRKKSNFEKIKTHFKVTHPKRLLEKGYSILFDEKKNSVILSSKNVIPNQRVRVKLSDGVIGAKITDVRASKE